MNDAHQTVLDSSARFPPPQGVRFSYGTSRFRADASILDSTVYMIGILAALRSLKTRAVIGLMITASHNQVSDNGVKIADPTGEMLSQEWEPFADSLANAPTSQHLLQLIVEFGKKENIQFEGTHGAKVLLGRDTRPSGESLLEAAKQGVSSIVGAVAVNIGVVTTPQLHWMVRPTNSGAQASEHDYFNQLASSFGSVLQEGNSKNDKLIVDAANGVGGEKLELLKKRIHGLNLDVRNSGKEGVLNDGVGADFVQKEKVTPCGFGPGDVGVRCSSLDGDADRLVYFMVIPNSNGPNSCIDLVDGDKILSLFALFIKEQLCILNEANNSYQAHLEVVQTAYANGASTDYLKQVGLEVVLTPTGVKYLHEKAAGYDIGIYFEANGHGTILFSCHFLTWLEGNELSSTSKDSEQLKASLRLLAVSKLINQAVGDALSGLLLVEVILQLQKWNKLYCDLPSKQLKVTVVDRTAVVTAKAETEAVSPPGMQEAINAITVNYPQGRCFVWPSGTEDVVRVYAEASTQEAAEELAMSVAKLTDQFLGSP